MPPAYGIVLTRTNSKQHYFETAVEHEISSSNICTIILTFLYDFIVLTVLGFDKKQNKNIRQETDDCFIVLIALKFDPEKNGIE